MKREISTVLDQQGRLPGCFFLYRKGEEEGPFSLKELEALHKSGKISSATPCRSRSAREWHDLAFVLREAADEPPGWGPIGMQNNGTGAKEESLKDLVTDLVGVSQRQNRSLNSIKWSLIILIVLTAGVIIALQ